ncbi:MAG: redoxin domain-containing protein [Flavobacteriales bacterium]
MDIQAFEPECPTPTPEIRTIREGADPQDLGLIKELANQERSIATALENSLDSLIAVDPEGQFAFAVRTDRMLDASILDGPQGIRRTFDFSNPRNLRSSSYSKAVMVYLQNTPWTTDMALQYACDTLLVSAANDSACWIYMRSYLVELFATYGPADLAQYLVDRYVVGTGSRFPPDERLLVLAAEQMRVVNGAPAPEVHLITPGASDTTKLSDIVRQHDYTALFFYSSTCDHCHEQMPGLQVIVNEVPSKKFQVIGIALDVDVTEFRQAIIDHGMNWPCYSHLIGWGEPAAKNMRSRRPPHSS